MGDMSCRECGLVISERVIDLRNEWRNFSESDKNRSRAAAVDDYITDLSTDIASIPFSENKEKTDRMSKIQRRNALSSEGKVLYDIASSINRYSEMLRLSNDIREKAKFIYKELYELSSKDKKYKMKGLKSSEMVVAVIYRALKERRISRTMKELSLETGVDEKKMKKYTSKINSILKSDNGVIDLDALVTRFCSYLNLNYKIEMLSIRIANFLRPKLEGKKPETITAVAIYMAALITKAPISEKEIANATHLSATTIKNVYKDVEIHQAQFEEEYSKNNS